MSPESHLPAACHAWSALGFLGKPVLPPHQNLEPCPFARSAGFPEENSGCCKFPHKRTGYTEMLKYLRSNPKRGKATGESTVPLPIKFPVIADETTINPTWTILVLLPVPCHMYIYQQNYFVINVYLKQDWKTRGRLPFNVYSGLI